MRSIKAQIFYSRVFEIYALSLLYYYRVMELKERPSPPPPPNKKNYQERENKTHHVPRPRPSTPWIRNPGVGPADEGADSTSRADPETSYQIHARATVPL